MKKLFYLLVLSVIVFSCGEKKIEEDEIFELPVIVVSSSDTLIKVEYPTSIEAKKNIEIRSHISGFISKIHFDEGQKVSKGQLLFSINQDVYLAEVDRARASLKNALSEYKVSELEVERVKSLTDKKVISESELKFAKVKQESLSAKINEAESVLKNAQLMLSYTKIKSPFDGIVNIIPMKIGSRVEEGSLLTSLSDISEVYAYFNISESQYLALNKVDTTDAFKKIKIELVLADGTIHEVKGNIQTTSTEFQESTGNIAFRAVFENEDELLKHGSTGKVLIPRKFKNVFCIPSKSVYEIQDKNYVYVVNKDSIAKLTEVKVVNRLYQIFVINSGLNNGDKIVYEGLQKIKDGSKIKPIISDLKSVKIEKFSNR